MISADISANLLPWSLQVAGVVAAASLLPWLFRLDVAGVRYAYWRTVAVLCLALPWIQPYHEARFSTQAARSATATVNSVGDVVVHADPTVNWETLLGSALAVGIIVRLAWLLVGLVKLRKLRQRAALHATVTIDGDLQSLLATRSEVRYAPDVDHPITFGVLKPIVILPDSLRTQSRDIQCAVLGHELLHVKRRDWAWLIAEEIAVCLFWFHPASWWLASQIQRAREEVVDELAILHTGRRKAYVEALLAFSDATSVVPTAAFARRRHLFRRIALVSKESVMSSRRVVTTCAAMALIVVTGSWYAVSAFPLQVRPQSRVTSQIEAGPLERKAHNVTPENPIPRRVHYEEPVLPDWVGAERAVLDVKITLDDVGRVAEARMLDIYQPSSFKRDTNQTRQTNEALIEAALASVRQWRYDAPFEAPLAFTIQVHIGKGAPAMEFKPRSEDGALRVGGEIKAPKKIKDVRPIYPPIARQAGVSGVVIIEAKIGADGFVEEAYVLKSSPLLDEAALDAVKQWQFEPTLMNGQPTAVRMTLTINFTTEHHQ